jgi:hypothetical protein
MPDLVIALREAWVMRSVERIGQLRLALAVR